MSKKLQHNRPAQSAGQLIVNDGRPIKARAAIMGLPIRADPITTPNKEQQKGGSNPEAHG